MVMTIKDLEKLERKLGEDTQDYFLELQKGEIIVMGPSDIISSEIGAELIYLLKMWINPRKLGRVFDSSGGFIMPNTDLRAPDVSFVSADRLKTSQRYFAELVPDLVVKIKSQSDYIAKLKKKIKLFIKQGAKVGILIDPDLQTVTVYRANGDIITLTNDDKLTLPELLPGWEINIMDLWPPVFE
jgi:Uma2 family endonuclease